MDNAYKNKQDLKTKKLIKIETNLDNEPVIIFNDGSSLTLKNSRVVQSDTKGLAVYPILGR